MKFVPKNPASFRNVLNVLKGVNDEIYVTPKKNSVVFWTIDPPKTMIYSAVLPKSSMIDYEIDEEEIDQITTYDIKYFEKALRKIKVDTPFVFNQRAGGLTEIQIEKPVKLKVKIPQYSTDISQIDLPEIPFTVWLECYGALINDVFSTIKAFSPEIKFSATEKSLKILGETEVTEVIAEIDSEHDWVISYDVEEPAEAKFDLKRLITVTKGIAKNSEVQLAFASDTPLYMHWEDTEGFKHSFLLAPVVDE